MIPAHRFFYLLIALALTAGIVSAQVATGVPPFGSFGGGPHVINLANLNSHITLPVDPHCDSPVDPVYTGSATAVDGSGYLLTVNEQANPSIVVTRPNGQIINNPGSSTATVIDPNGNELTTNLVGSNTTFTDTLGTT